MTERLLSPAQAERFYDRFGKKLDSQTFYEAPALNDLAAHLDLETCRAVLEFGSGTGRFAEELFETRLPPHAIYVGRDISKVMVRLAKERLARFGPRATVEKSDGARSNGQPERRLRQIYLALSSWTCSPMPRRKQSYGKRTGCWPQAASPAWSV